MAFGDCLKQALKNGDLLECEPGRSVEKPFFETIRNIAYEDIKAVAPAEVDSAVATEVYYKILSENTDKLNPKLLMETSSNGQEFFRVSVRNMFSSNSMRSTSLANQANIKTRRKDNEDRRGQRTIYRYEE